jgi:putative sugar O-methyltransferase
MYPADVTPEAPTGASLVGDEVRLARLLTSVAFRGLGASEASLLIEAATAVSASPNGIAGRSSMSSKAGRIKAAVKGALRPVARVPLVADLRQRMNENLKRFTTSRDDNLINRAAAIAHSGRFDEALELLGRAARINPANSRLEPHFGRIRFLISRSKDPSVPVEIRAMLDALELMNRELDRNPVYAASEFWNSAGAFHVELLKAYGIENFKRTVSHCYQNWMMVSLDDPQVRRLLETWVAHRKIEPFVNDIEHPDHVGFHLKLDFNEPEYLLAKGPEREIYRLAVGLLWEHVLQGDRKHILEPLEEMEVGNPIRISRRGRLISSDLAHSVRERTLLLDQLSLTGQEGLIVGELGAGHGRLAEVFGRTTNYRFYIFDIAPALYISHWYIKKIFPHEKIFSFRPFDHWSEVRDEVAASRFAFFTANQIELVPNDSIQLFINMNSLMEMRRDQINNFLKQIGRLTTKGFLSRQWLRWRNHLDDLTVEKDDFVLTDGWRKVLDCVDDIYPEFFNQIWERNDAS